MFRAFRIGALAFLLGFGLPLGAHALVQWHAVDWTRNWSNADWSSTGSLPPASAASPALVRIYAARVGRWRSIFAVHSWIVFKPADADGYDRYDVVGWSGTPVRHNIRPPDARWYGNAPQLVVALEGEAAERLIPKLRAAIASYPFAEAGDYRAWPGPNSNTFIAHIVAQVPEIAAALPSTAIGKDFPVDGRWFGPAPSRTGIRFTLGGYAGLTLAWVEGIEFNLLGAVAGLDLRRPGIKLPGFGRIGI
ncbi:DUF3750 domain-containing protein [Ancylobacter amanitiformis]|uniref:DUF3750 domain-containing protein n=1 Tax=Ancylobacter amanitiformis TaxID=217069 RepID=A0ABU0LLA5_9HYPH|nr:DUF3750 domain-containing protein [Ancylobacter amanitiformis]MDQ0509485.1 hypothetical protein [Ancylobacter amanitiformis]